MSVATRRRGRRAGAARAAERPPYLRLALIGAGVVLGAFLLGYVLTFLLFFPGFGRSAITNVPDLRGMPRAEAERAVERAGLEVEVASRLPHPEVPAGVVLAQTPLPGEEVARGSAVDVVLSAGPAARAMPAVEGLRAEEARAMLERLGWEVTVSEVRHERRAGTVVESRPAAGEPAPQPGPVALVVSAGPPRVQVPSVVGVGQGHAATLLQAAGLRLGAVDYDPYAHAPAGDVVFQEPAGGETLPMGSSVRVIVSGWDPAPPPPPHEPPDAPDDAGGDFSPRG